MSNAASSPLLIPPPSTPAPLRQRAVNGTIWTIAATYGGQLIRLGSNLVLTRLLFPEAFGLMAVALLIIEALNLFSDLGTQAALIQDERGDDPTFINTAWTLQVIRGLVLWMVTGAVALGLHVAGSAGLLPPGSAFADPRLLMLLVVVGSGFLATGFFSTKIITMRRHLDLAAESIYQLSTRIIVAAILIAAAWIEPSVWALAVGTVAGTAISAAISQFMLPGPRNRFVWDRAVAASLIRFGRIIVFSTSFTFIAASAQRVILGWIMPAELFGIYSIALLLSTVVVLGLERVSENVLFPLYSQLARRGDAQGMQRNVTRVRVRLLALMIPPMWVIAILGGHMVSWLYDPRYHEAGWMLRVLALAGVGTLITMTLQGIMLAHGDAKRHLGYTVAGSVLLVGSMAVGGLAGGVPGVLISAVIGKALQHVVLLACVRRYGLRTLGLDVAVIVLTAIVVGLGWWLVPA